eukprot:TRINITY_DN3081_c0_g1_i1.p1 TRINITY_DN3081_c0_g1~~TRINITY_DN3081_c0_g1_i1.p1  ORF type:complete len:400 (+),score=91.37 TRINITY_DN3081_c0_g1_i1:3-1202(+)
MCSTVFFFQAEDGIRDLVRSRGLGDVYKRQVSTQSTGPTTSNMQTSGRRRNLRWLAIAAVTVLALLLYTSQTSGPPKWGQLGWLGWRKSVLVTGGLGFIGSHLVEDLIEHGYKVTIYDDESNGHNHNTGASFVRGDVRVVNDLTMVLPGQADYVVHLAAAISVAESMRLPGKYYETNVDGSRAVLDMARSRWNTKMLVAASSAAIYGTTAPLPIEEKSGYGGISPYADSKFRMELEMEKANKQHGLKSIALRFFNVYGPRQDPKSDYSGVMSKFMQSATQAPNVIKVFGDGAQTRDFVYVKDIARAIRTALESELSRFDAFNVCTGKKTSIQDLAITIKQKFSTGGASIGIANQPAREGDIRESVCNPSKATQLLGFTASYTVAEGMEHTRDWYLSTLK